MEELTKVVLFNTVTGAGNSLFFVFVFYHLALTGASTNNCAYCCCDGTRSSCKSPGAGAGAGHGWRKSIAEVFRILIGMRMFDYFVIFMLFLWNFYDMEGGGFVWDGLFLPQVVSFLGMTLSYCLVVVSRKRRNDILNNKRHCCRCHDHGHQLPAATADVADDEEKQELLINTSSDNCGCCCCSGESEAGNSTDGGQSNCKLYGAGADQDPKIKLITKRFRMIAGISMLFHLGIFMMYLWGISFLSSTS